MSNQVYYTKSMNGINSFDDGSGTVIEDGIIITDTLDVTNLTTTNLSTYDLTVNHDLTVVNNIQSGFLHVDNNIAGEFIRINDQFGSFYGQSIDSDINAGDINIYSITDNAFLRMGGNTTNITIGENSMGELNMCPNSSLINIGNNSSGNVTIGNTGIISLGNKIKIQGTSIYGGLVNDNMTLFSTQTTGNITIGGNTSSGNINIGNTGIIKLGNIIKIQGTQIFGGTINDTMTLFPDQTGGGVQFATGLTTGTCNICTALTASGNLNIGNLGVIKLGHIIKIQGTQIFGGAINDTMAIFPTQTGGDIQIGSGLTTGSCNIAPALTSGTCNIASSLTSGSVQIGNSTILSIIKLGNILKVKGAELYGGTINDTIGLLPTQVGGEIQIGSGLTTGVCLIGQNMTTGYTQLGQYFKFLGLNMQGSTITTITYGLLNNLTTASINLGTSITTGLITIGNSGTVAIGSILKVGTSQIWGYTKFGTSNNSFSIPSSININYFFNATGTQAVHVLTLPSYIDGQTIFIRNQKTTGTFVVSCYATQSLSLKNGGSATTLSMATTTYAILIGTATTWYVLN